ncbi:MAG: lasso RiPP family leader peptide-containing protein [Arenicella sp.]|nr:lasso RiPP family leader peptide-containing protein [Arenicella sp.]
MKQQKTQIESNSGLNLSSARKQVADREVGVYQKPLLTCYGDVRDVTLGPTAGFGESGCATLRQPGSGGAGSCP